MYSLFNKIDFYATITTRSTAYVSLGATIRSATSVLQANSVTCGFRRKTKTEKKNGDDCVIPRSSYLFQSRFCPFESNFDVTRRYSSFILPVFQFFYRQVNFFDPFPKNNVALNFCNFLNDFNPILVTKSIQFFSSSGFLL